MMAPRMTSDIRVAIPDPHYSLIDTSRGDLPAVVVVNDAVFSFNRKDVFAWHLEITIEAIDLAKNRMPTSRESKLLDELGDTIESLLQQAKTKHGSTNVLFLARVTCDSRRELIYRIHDPELANGALSKAVTEHQTREWSFNMFRDDSWDAAQIFEDLYESAE
jgi:hypothetical protein